MGTKKKVASADPDEEKVCVLYTLDIRRTQDKVQGHV